MVTVPLSTAALSMLLTLVQASYPQPELRGSYIGRCGADGFYYHDAESFIICSNGIGFRQPCAPGTSNDNPQSYSNSGYGNRAVFCGVNLISQSYLKHYGIDTGRRGGHGNNGYTPGYQPVQHPPHSSQPAYANPSYGHSTQSYTRHNIQSYVSPAYSYGTLGYGSPSYPTYSPPHRPHVRPPYTGPYLLAVAPSLSSTFYRSGSEGHSEPNEHLTTRTPEPSDYLTYGAHSSGKTEKKYAKPAYSYSSKLYYNKPLEYRSEESKATYRPYQKDHKPAFKRDQPPFTPVLTYNPADALVKQQSPSTTDTTGNSERRPQRNDLSKNYSKPSNNNPSIYRSPSYSTLMGYKPSVGFSVPVYKTSGDLPRASQTYQNTGYKN